MKEETSWAVVISVMQDLVEAIILRARNDEQHKRLICVVKKHTQVFYLCFEGNTISSNLKGLTIDQVPT